MIDHNLIDQATVWLAQGVARSLTRPVSAGLGNRPRLLKALCEIGFLEYEVTASPSANLREAIGPILKQEILTPSFLSFFYHNIVHANLFLPLGLAAIRAHGASPGYLEDFHTLGNMALHHTKERLPFRILDLLHGAYRLSGDQCYLNRMIEAAHLGCIGGLADPLDVNISDDYAITHTIFYLTDFGRLPWPETLCDPGIIMEVLDHLSILAEREENCDLLGEYLLCRLMLGQCGPIGEYQIDYLHTHALNGRKEMEGGDGKFWQGPADLSSTLEKEGISETDMGFYQNYHTTLVVLEALKRATATSSQVAPSPIRIWPQTEKSPPQNTQIETEHKSTVYRADLLRAYTALLSDNSDNFFDRHSARLEDPDHILTAVEYAYWASRTIPLPEEWQKKLLELTAAYTPKMHDNSRFIRLLVLAADMVGGLPPIPLKQVNQDAQAAEMAYRQAPDTMGETLVDRLVVLSVLMKRKTDPDRNEVPGAYSLISRSLILLHADKAWCEFATLLAYAADVLNEPCKARLLEQAERLQPKSLAAGWLAPRTAEEKDLADRLSLALNQVNMAVLPHGTGTLE